MIKARCLIGLFAAIGVAAVLAGCGGSTQSADPATVTVGGEATTVVETVTETVFEEAPDATPAEETDTIPTDPGRTEVQVGETAEDDGLVFKVTSIKEVDSAAVDPDEDIESRTILKPIDGAKLIQVDLTYKNETPQRVDPFCGGSSAILLDTEQNNYNPVENHYAIIGSNACGNGLQPGFRLKERLVFQVPQGAEILGVALFNDDSNTPDYGGEQSYVVFTV